jgi:hypothetical protein
LQMSNKNKPGMSYKCQISTTLEWVANVKPVNLLNKLQMSNKNNTGMSYKCQISPTFKWITNVK